MKNRMKDMIRTELETFMVEEWTRLTEAGFPGADKRVTQKAVYEAVKAKFGANLALSEDKLSDKLINMRKNKTLPTQAEIKAWKKAKAVV